MFDQFIDFLFSRWFWLPSILFLGIFLIYLGKRRIRSEAQPDPRYDLIPDEDVKQFWRWMSTFNIQKSYFYIYFFGPLLIAFALVNGIILLLFNLPIPEEIFMPNRPFICFCFFLSVGFLTECASVNQSSPNGPGGSVVRVNKIVIIDIYQSIGFRSRTERDWIIKNLKPPVGELKKYYQWQLDALNRIRYIPFFWPFGHIIWFTTWTVLFIYITASIYFYNFH